MKKSVKVILGIVSIVLILIVSYIVLIIKGILPNPFLDTSDLVCGRQIDYVTEIEEEQEIIKFDKFQRAIETVSVFSRIYPTLEVAISVYNKVEDKNFFKLNKEKKAIESTSVEHISEKSPLYKKSKVEVKDFYLNELYYEFCK